MDYQKLQKNLPSKKFAIIIGGLIVIVPTILFASSYFGSTQLFRKNGDVSAQGKTVGDLVSLDSNNNGIPDWQESLWGLDPKANGAKNKEIIDQKLAAANITPADATATSTQDNTPTAAFAQQLLSTVLALQQSGDLNQTSIDQINSTLESDIDAQRPTTPAYTLDNMTISDDTSATAETAYENQFKAITLKYKNSGMGNEFDVMGLMLNDTSGDNSILAKQELDPIATAYVNYSKDIMSLDTPTDAAPLALALANASETMGISLGQTETIYTDALTGMVGIDNYINEINPLSQASTAMIAFFVKQK